MGKTLIIAEKPSVAQDIAKALGGFTKHDEYYESDGGHIWKNWRIYLTKFAPMLFK